MTNKFYIFFCLPFLLNGCISHSIPPADIYTISPVWNERISNQSVSNEFIIKLAPVRATREQTSTKIFYKNNDYGRNSYAYSRWNDSPVRLLLTFFQVSIEKSTLFKAIVPPISTSKVDLLLESTLLEFSHHLQSDNSSEGVIRVHFYLIDNISKKVISTKEFVARKTAKTKDAQGAVVALNKASAEIADQLIQWLAMIEY